MTEDEVPPSSEDAFLLWAPPGHFYSPLPDIRSIREDYERIFARPDALAGIDLRESAQLDLLSSISGTLADSASSWPIRPDPDWRYHSSNPQFGLPDASVVAALADHLRPRRYLEVGSGWSTAALLDARQRWSAGAPTHITSIDPYPERLHSLLRDEDAINVVSETVQRAPIDWFLELERDDILFIDSSHVVKVGSDVHHLFNRVLPVLAPGVWIHIHDIFWPFEYAMPWFEEGRAWNEAYLVQAFLSFNDAFEIQLFNNWLSVAHRDELAAISPPLADGSAVSLWLTRTR